MTKKFLNVMQDMYKGSMTTVKCAVGLTKWFYEKIGPHQGSAWSPFFFAMVLNRLTNEIREK